MDGMVLVTGGAGFIGSHVADALVERGVDVRILDDFSTGRVENLDGFEARAAAGGARTQVIQGDVRDVSTVNDCLDGCEAVVHLAAVASVTRSIEDPIGSDAVTHGGTLNVVREAVELGVERIVLASSCAVYGDAAELPIAETSSPRPLSPYASSKLASEEVCQAAADDDQFAAAFCLRFFNVYGPRQDPSSEYSGVISRFLTAAVRGEPVTIYGDGEQTRDFVYVGDLVDAVLRALWRPARGASLLNIGSGSATSLLGILDTLGGLLHCEVGRSFAPAREGDIRHSLADVGRARWVLGWEARTSFDEGLAATLDWYRQTEAAERA